MRAIVLLVVGLAAGSCSDPSLAVDGARAHARVVRQVAFGPRVPGTPGHAAALAWMITEAQRLGGRIERQTFTDTVGGRPYELTNVIARFGPGSARRVALTAHWDSRPWCDEDPDSSARELPLPGANDGGSGVAVLLEVAEALHLKPPAIGVDLVFFDGEDLGHHDRPDDYCRGSRGYARRLPPPGDDARPVAAFNFDMVGDRDPAFYDEGNSASRAASLVELVHEAAAATGGRSFHAESRYTLVDDHVPLLDAGLPAADVIDFEYPAWHTHRDLPDQVSPATLAEVARVALWLVRHSALTAR